VGQLANADSLGIAHKIQAYIASLVLGDLKNVTLEGDPFFLFFEPIILLQALKRCQRW